MEEFGNKLGFPFVCPAGHRHKGEGFCVYSGTYVRNEFHGVGEIKCYTGRSYKGNFVHGKMEGEVTSVAHLVMKRPLFYFQA